MIFIGPIYGDLEPQVGVLGGPFDLGLGRSFGPRPTWLTPEVLPDAKRIGTSDLDSILRAPYYFVVTTDVQHMRDGEWERALEAMRMMQQSLWIASGIRLEGGLALAIESSEDGHRFVRLDRLEVQVSPIRSADRILRAAQLEEMHGVLGAIGTMKRKGAVWTATRVAAHALDHRQADIAHLLVWTGLEALFGPEGPGETVYRTTLSLALFLSERPESARELASRAKKSYNLRSAIVHGRQAGLAPEASKVDHNKDLFLETISWLRGAIKRIVLDPNLLETFQSAKKREEFCSSLAFRVQPQTTQDAT